MNDKMELSIHVAAKSSLAALGAAHIRTYPELVVNMSSCIMFATVHTVCSPVLVVRQYSPRTRDMATQTDVRLVIRLSPVDL